MKKQPKLFLFLIILFFSEISSLKSFAQSKLVYEDMVYQAGIETVVFYKTGKINTYPLLDIENPTQTLTLAFDDLEGGYKTFSYRLIHCDADWKPSDLYTGEYLEGQEYDDITKYDFSSNTYVSYTNYHVNIPSENMSFKMTGNYLIKVYESGDEEKLILTRRFYVASSQIIVTANVNRPSYAKYRKYKQELDFEVNYEKLNVMNPLIDFKVVMRQNQRWDNEITDLKPMYVNGNNLIYDFETENIFDGLSEWRYSDLRPLKYPGFGVNKVELDTIYNMYLLTEEDRSYLAYAEWKDINGNRVIAGENKDLNMNEIDYVATHFRLTTPYPKDEEVYLFGALTDWKIQDQFKMTYNASKNAYTADILLKQGYYNYYYVTYNADSNKVDCIRFQGDHFETENDYLIVIYLKSRFYETHEIVGYAILNSRKN